MDTEQNKRELREQRKQFVRNPDTEIPAGEKERIRCLKEFKREIKQDFRLKEIGRQVEELCRSFPIEF